MAQPEQEPKVSQDTNVEPQAEQPSVEEAVSMTKADLDAYMNERLEGLSSQWQARIDQRATKLEMGLQKRLGEADGLISQLQKQGVDINDEAQKALRTEIIQEAYRKPVQENPETFSETEIKTITDAGQRMLESFGLTESDPEWSNLVTDASPQDYFNSIAEAGRAKLGRDGGGGAPAQAAVPSGGARPAGAGAPPNPFAVNLDDLYKRANDATRKKAGI